jgi:hypothetical protein
MSVIPHYPYTLNINDFYIRKAYARRDKRKITDFTDFTDRLDPRRRRPPYLASGLQSDFAPPLPPSSIADFLFDAKTLIDGRF